MKIKTKATRFVYKIHKWTGLSIALFIIIIGLTGSALVYLDELKFFTNESMRVSVSGKELSPQTLLDNILDNKNGIYISLLEKSSAPDIAYKIYYHKDNESFIANINQYTGSIINEGLASFGLMHFVYDVHVSFALSPWGDIIASAIAALLVVSSLTGFWLQRKYLFHVFKIGVRTNKGAKASFSDSHKLLGALSLLTNLVLGGTGVFITLHVFSVDFIQNGHHHYPNAMKNQYSFSIDSLNNDVHKRISSFTLSYIEFPQTRNGELIFSGRVPFGNLLYRPNYGTSSVAYNISDGEWIATNDIRTSELTRKSSVFFHELHYGKYAGWPIKIVYFLAGLFPAALAVTGFVVWKQKVDQLKFSSQNQKQKTK
jgi:uncharacterized iron-regulated membrane protein